MTPGPPGDGGGGMGGMGAVEVGRCSTAVHPLHYKT
jgi:hypothetical protein